MLILGKPSKVWLELLNGILTRGKKSIALCKQEFGGLGGVLSLLSFISLSYLLFLLAFLSFLSSDIIFLIQYIIYITLIKDNNYI